MNLKRVLEKNIDALKRYSPDLAVKIMHIEASHKLRVKTAPSGDPVPVIRTKKGERSLHSSVRPREEGRRISETFEKEGFYIFSGLGAGYHIRPLLSTRIKGGMVIERDLSLFKALLQNFDFSDFFSIPDLVFLVDPDKQEIRRSLLYNYIPAVMAGLFSLPLRARIQEDPDGFATIARWIEEGLEEVRADYSVQARFGKQWIRNALLNIPSLEESNNSANLGEVFNKHKSAAICAAGPGIDRSIDSLSSLSTKVPIIASDTSYPAILARGIRPDCIVSIDCQHISYLHFFDLIALNTVLCLDISSPPLLKRRAGTVLFFRGGHPLGNYIDRYWLGLHSLDTSGGNVSHAAISLAASMGARTVYLYGADFSYPEAKAYAKGSYFYTYFRKAEDRLHPAFSSSLNFVLSSSRLINREEFLNGEKAAIYGNDKMDLYKKRLLMYAEKHRTNIHFSQSPDFPQVLNRLPETSSEAEDKLVLRKKKDIDWKGFLSDYRDKIIGIEMPGLRYKSYFENLNREDQDVFLTLVPSMAYSRAAFNDLGENELFEKTRKWTLNYIDNVLGNYTS